MDTYEVTEYGIDVPGWVIVAGLAGLGILITLVVWFVATRRKASTSPTTRAH